MDLRRKYYRKHLLSSQWDDVRSPKQKENWNIHKIAEVKDSLLKNH